MIKKKYPGLKFDANKQEYEFHEIPGLKEAGWTLQSYEQAK
jgi:hypothetical protein